MRRIGFVLPSTNTTVESDCADMRPPGVSNHAARVMVVERPLTSDQAFMEHVALMRSGIAGAIDQVITCKPDHLIMGVALEAFWGGLDSATALQAELEARAGVGVSMGGSATVTALRALDCRRIAVLTPHQPRGDAMVRLYLEQAGFEIVTLLGLKCASPHLIASVPDCELRAALHQLNGPDVQAIVQVGTALPAMRMAAAAERWLEKPVLAINTVLYWDALRRAGVTTQVPGYGMLLERY